MNAYLSIACAAEESRCKRHSARKAERSRKTPLRAGHIWPVSLNVAAPLLKVSKGHLCQVLRGTRISGPVTRGYAALVAKQGGAQ